MPFYRAESRCLGPKTLLELNKMNTFHHKNLRQSVQTVSWHQSACGDLILAFDLIQPVKNSLKNLGWYCQITAPFEG